MGSRRVQRNLQGRILRELCCGWSWVFPFRVERPAYPVVVSLKVLTWQRVEGSIDFPLDIPQEEADTPLNIPHERKHPMAETRSPILQGTLDLMVLKTLEQMGSLHGYGIARRIEQVGQDALVVNQGTIYLCLVRLVQKKWITAEWGKSENGRKAKFYSLTKAGQKQLQAEVENWDRISGVITRVLAPATEG